MKLLIACNNKLPSRPPWEIQVTQPHHVDLGIKTIVSCLQIFTYQSAFKPDARNLILQKQVQKQRLKTEIDQIYCIGLIFLTCYLSREISQFCKKNDLLVAVSQGLRGVSNLIVGYKISMVLLHFWAICEHDLFKKLEWYLVNFCYA